MLFRSPRGDVWKPPTRSAVPDGNPCWKHSDLDVGVIGGPRELALLTAKTSSGGGKMPDMKHPPTKAFSSAQEVEDQGLYAILP